MSAPVPAPARKLRLVADERPGVFERRRGECSRLASCESDWVAAHGSAQAACPTGCIRFVRRMVGPDPGLGSGGGAVMGGGAL